MSGSADLAVTAASLRRRLLFWRVIFFVALVVAAGFAFHHKSFSTGPVVDALAVNGLITDEPRRTRAIIAAKDNPHVRALILRIDSPGGTVTGGENLHDAIARFAASKPVVAVMTGEGASAAYMIAVPAQRIYAANATLTGSIGVIVESPDVSDLLGRIGVRVDKLVSGPLKGQPSITAPLSPAGRDMLQGIVGDLYDQFVAMVATGRHMDPARVRALADGRPYTGHQALPLGLIDAIGNEEDARDWLAAHAGVAKTLPIEEMAWQEKHSRWSFSSENLVQDAVASLVKTLVPQGLTLDGPLALWQPSRP